MKLVGTQTVLVFLVTLSGCGGGGGGELGSSEGALGQISERSGDDVAVLQAWFGPMLTKNDALSTTGKTLIDLANCQGEDCTREVEAALRLVDASQVSPVIGEYRYTPRSGDCDVIEIRTVVKDAALEASSFVGVGFYREAFGPWAGRFDEVGKDRLHAVGHVTLKNGEPATVLRFILQGMCFGQGGNGGSIFSRSFGFKPFARFDDGGVTYRVWDVIEGNYHLGRKQYPNRDWVGSFNREEELLRK